MSIREKIDAYHGKFADGTPWRYRSWEHCFGFFRRNGANGVAVARHDAALQLGFYLASWGMYRGSSRLLQYDYTVHLPVVDRLAESRFATLWQEDLGSQYGHETLGPLVLCAAEAVKAAYEPYAAATDTLVTKVMLGVLGCVPACDRFFIDGFTSKGFQYSYLNLKFINRVLRFCVENVSDLRAEQARIAASGNSHYPLMKLVDMYFWQIGFERCVQPPFLTPLGPLDFLPDLAAAPPDLTRYWHLPHS